MQGRLATNVRRLREERGLTQEQAADLCGMATRLLQRVEAGGSNVTFATLARFCAGFGVEASDLVGEERTTTGQNVEPNSSL